jgi:Meckel syndrome type 1 protein
MAEPHDPNRRTDPGHDPRADPGLHHSDPVYDDRLHARPTDPAVDPDAAFDPAVRRANDPVLSERPMATGRGGLIAAGIVAALLVIAVIAFSSGTNTDPGTTAVIPDQTDTAPAPAPDAAPQPPATPAPATPPAE